MGKRKRREDKLNVLEGARLYYYKNKKVNSNNNNNDDDNNDEDLISNASKITSANRSNYCIKIMGDIGNGILASLVLPNRICVLIFNGKKSIGINNNNNDKISIISLIYHKGLEEKTKEVTGKKKKNSLYIEAGDTICNINYKINNDDNIKSYKLCSPISGHLIETNDKIKINPNLIIDQPYNCGYIAVLFPTYDIVNVMTNGLIKNDTTNEIDI